MDRKNTVPKEPNAVEVADFSSLPCCIDCIVSIKSKTVRMSQILVTTIFFERQQVHFIVNFMYIIIR